MSQGTSIKGKTAGDKSVSVLVDDSGKILVKSGGLLNGVEYDYLSVAYTDTDTETYTYKLGGSGGTTVATVTVNYTDASKANISSVERS